MIAPALLSTSASMKNSIMRCGFRPLWPASGPTCTSKLFPAYGTADDNVHPNNSMQLIRALQQAGKSFDVQVGPDAGHSGINPQRMMEFFIEALVLNGATG